MTNQSLCYQRLLSFDLVNNQFLADLTANQYNTLSEDEYRTLAYIKVLLEYGLGIKTIDIDRVTELAIHLLKSQYQKSQA